MTKTINVEYFAILREQRGLAQEKLTTASTTAAEFYDELRGRHGFTLEAGRLRVAVNDEFVPWGSPLHEGDTLVFIPPVAGG
jgi:molybdopterin synthase sulfur carrier subunit